MPNHDHLYDVVLFLLATVVVVPLFERLRASPLVGYLVAGAVIGPAGFAIVGDAESARGVAELGIVVMLFSVGLELTLERIRLMSPKVLGIGAAQLLLTAGVGFAVSVAAGLSVEGGIVIGAALGLSSTAVVLQLLIERHELSTRIGRKAFGVLILQDLAVGPLLVLIPILGEGSGSILSALGTAAWRATLVLILIAVVGRVVLRPLYRLMMASRAPELFTGMNMLVIIGTAMATYAAGLSMALGALLAGILLAETEFRRRVEEDIRPFQGLLMGLFFMTVGMFIDVRLALDKAGLVVLLVVGLMGGKVLLVTIASRLLRLSWVSGLRLGLLLGQGGAFGFVFLTMAQQDGLLESETARLVMLVIACSMALTPLLAAVGGWLGHRLEPADAPGVAELKAATDGVYDHVVVAGFGRVGNLVSERFATQKIPFFVLESDRRRVIDGRARNLPVFLVDASRPEVLDAARVHRASAVIVALGASKGVPELVALLRYLFPELRILAHAHDDAASRVLMRVGADEVAVEIEEAGQRLAAAVVVPVEHPMEH